MARRRLTDEEIIEKQERLYDLERYCSTGKPISDQKQIEIILAFFAEDYFDKLDAKVETKKQELRQKIINAKDPKEQEKLKRKLALVLEVNKEPLGNNHHRNVSP